MIDVLAYTFELFTPHKKKDVMKFLESLSFQTRNMLSISGVDPKTIYSSFREEWWNTAPVCVYHQKEILAIGKLSDWGKGLYLSCLVVRDDMQRKGIGTKLLKYLFALALLNGSKKILLEVRKDNSAGLSFFKRMGFKIMQEETYTYRMERNL